MPIALTLDYDTLTFEDYQAVGKALDFPTDWPPGLLYHDAAVVDGRLRVYEAWESREDFDRLVRDKLATVVGETLGDRAEAPHVTEHGLRTSYLRP